MRTSSRTPHPSTGNESDYNLATVFTKLDETSALVKAHLLDAKRLSKLQCADRGSTRFRSQNWKFCPKCWEAVEENAKFCPNRGKKIK
jgi:hypothetical protein